MRIAATLLLALLLAACGEADQQPSSTPDPDQPVQAPAQTTEPPASPPDPHTCQKVADRLPGETFDRAQSLARAKGCGLRIIEADGQSLPITEDYSETRINVIVDGGEITAVDGLY